MPSSRRTTRSSPSPGCGSAGAIPRSQEIVRSCTIITVPPNETAGADPRPHAGDPRPRRLAALARRGIRPSGRICSKLLRPFAGRRACAPSASASGSTTCATTTRRCSCRNDGRRQPRPLAAWRAAYPCRLRRSCRRSPSIGPAGTGAAFRASPRPWRCSRSAARRLGGGRGASRRLALLSSALSAVGGASRRRGRSCRSTACSRAALRRDRAGGAHRARRSLSLPPEARRAARRPPRRSVSACAIALLLVEKRDRRGRDAPRAAAARVPLARFDRGATTSWCWRCGRSWRRPRRDGPRRSRIAVALACRRRDLLSGERHGGARGRCVARGFRRRPGSRHGSPQPRSRRGWCSSPSPCRSPRLLTRAVVAIHHAAPWIKYSGIHRLLIWRFTADRIAERPALGWGMDASRALPGGKTDLAQLFPDAGLLPGSEALPLHPHDAPCCNGRSSWAYPERCLRLAFVGWGLWRVGMDPRLPRPAACRGAWLGRGRAGHCAAGLRHLAGVVVVVSVPDRRPLRRGHRAGSGNASR